MSISIHVPREGHDLTAEAKAIREEEFLSTCPVRGTTALSPEENDRLVISIHVPREGHDERLEATT